MMATTPSLFDRLVGFAGPRTYIWGTRTLAENPRAAAIDERLRSAGINTVAVPESGHHPNLDNPTGFAATIAEALWAVRPRK